MSLSKQFETNQAAEVQGVEVTYAPNEDGTVPTFVIARMGKSNKNYMKALEKATRPHRRAIELNILDNETADDIFTGVFAETVLIGWKNIKTSDITGDSNDEGYSPYSKINATRLLKRLPDLYDDLQRQASQASTFRDETLEDEAKN